MRENPSSSSFQALHSVLMTANEWSRGMRNGDCGQSIMLLFCHSFLLTVFPYYEIQSFTNCTSVDSFHGVQSSMGQNSCQKTCSRLDSFPWDHSSYTGLLLCGFFQCCPPAAVLHPSWPAGDDYLIHLLFRLQGKYLLQCLEHYLPFLPH